MNDINFLACGQVGDLIHSLYVIKSMCIVKKCKANLYISELASGLPCCGNFTFNINKTHTDIKELILKQDYIANFNILPEGFDQPIINLNAWRDYIDFLLKTTGYYSKCWSELMINKFSVNQITGNWIDIEGDKNTIDKVLIHSSTHRHNPNFDWNGVINQINDEVMFITTNIDEYNAFPFEKNKIKLYLRNDITQITSAIKNCKYFIGNQSSPFAIACALDKPRLVALSKSSECFYKDETKYYNNISWFINNNNKHLGNNPCNILI